MSTLNWKDWKEVSSHAIAALVGIGIGLAIGWRTAAAARGSTKHGSSAGVGGGTSVVTSACSRVDTAGDDSDDDSELVPPNVELKMVFCVRNDLAMSKGKIAAQVGHAVLACYREARRTHPEFVKAWLHRAQGKVTLKVDDEQTMDAIAEKCIAAGITCHIIEDAGRTEVEPGTRTVLGIGPAPKAAIDAITGPKGAVPLRLLS